LLPQEKEGFMKKAVLTAMMLSFAFGINAHAGEDHKHSKKEKQKSMKNYCEANLKTLQRYFQ